MAGVLTPFFRRPLGDSGRPGKWGGLDGGLCKDLRGTEAASLGSNKEAYEVTVEGTKTQPLLRRTPAWLA